MTEERIHRIAVLLTCHNRREKTLMCLEGLFQNQLPEKYTLNVFLVDDGSSDGTGGAVKQQFPNVHLIKGDGSLYWNGGMRLAFESAIHQSFDYYLWLNDDVELYPDAIMNLMEDYLNISQYAPVSIFVGATHDAVTGSITYSGWRSSDGRIFSMSKVIPEHKPVLCNTINGNCVLIPNNVANLVGNLDPVFTHTMGDMDYGFRVVKSGGKIWLASEFVGTCSQNSGENSWRDTRLPLNVRLKRLFGPKGVPVRGWLIFTKRYYGIKWPLYFVSPYLKVVGSHFIRKIFKPI